MKYKELYNVFQDGVDPEIIEVELLVGEVREWPYGVLIEDELSCNTNGENMIVIIKREIV